MAFMIDRILDRAIQHTDAERLWAEYHDDDDPRYERRNEFAWKLSIRRHEEGRSHPETAGAYVEQARAYEGQPYDFDDIEFPDIEVTQEQLDSIEMSSWQVVCHEAQAELEDEELDDLWEHQWHLRDPERDRLEASLVETLHHLHLVYWDDSAISCRHGESCLWYAADSHLAPSA